MSAAPISQVASLPLRERTELRRLQNGDRLSQTQFHARYQQMPDVKGAELIEGIVYMPSPVRAAQHGIPRANLTTWLGLYASRHPGLIFADNSTVILSDEDEFQPDLILALPAALGGKLRLDPEGYLVGAPELAIEIAASSVSIDLHAKLHVYRRAGVREYIVWRTEDAAFDCFVNSPAGFIPAHISSELIWSSSVFSGLSLNIPAALAGDLAKLPA